jgi:hypothetical protein
MDTSLSEYHAKFPGGCSWKINTQGVDAEGAVPIIGSKAMYSRAALLCNTHRQSFAFASAEFGVPVELLMACALIESAANDPETFVRQKPG